MRTCDLTLSGSSPTCFADGRLKFGRVIRIALIVCGSQVCALWSCVGKKLHHRTTRLTLYYYCGAQSVTRL